MTRLIIAPHVDDDVLGCASMIDADAVTLYCGVDAFHEVSSEERHREALAVQEARGNAIWWPTTTPCDSVRCHHYETKRAVNEYDVPSLIADITSAINVYRADEVLIPWPSYNQDHRAVYEAAMVALRPHDRNYFVRTVLVYEGSQVNFWDWAQPGTAFRPNYFVPVDIESKIALYSLMASQVRPFRSPEHLRALAAVRGGEIGAEYAEAFMALRMVVEA